MALQEDANSAVGQFISDRNRARQYDFLQSSFVVANYGSGLEIDHDFICALNFYATQYISPQPGRYRRHYDVKVGEHVPPEWFYVHDQMDEFLTILHRKWVSMDVLEAAAYTLWAINHIHPFCDGNGRTSRALCYFVLCRKLRDWVRGSTTIMELIRTESRDQYCDILKRMDAAKGADMMTDLTEMTAFLNDLVLKQIRTAPEIEG